MGQTECTELSWVKTAELNKKRLKWSLKPHCAMFHSVNRVQASISLRVFDS